MLSKEKKSDPKDKKIGQLHGDARGLSEARASKRCNPSAKGCAERFGSIGEGTATGLTIRHHNGSLVMSVTHSFGGIRWLGIDSSPSFVHS